MFRTKIWVVGIAALTATLLLPASPAMAQHRGGGAHVSGGGHPGRVYYAGGHPVQVHYVGGHPGRVYYGGGYYGYHRGYYSWPGIGVGVYGYPYYYYPSNTVIYGTFPSASYYHDPAANILPSGYATPSTNMAATLTIHVAPDAKIWFEDAATQQTGEWRTFASPPLEGGQTFHYTIHAVWNENGKTMDQIRTVEVRAGQTTNIDFLKPEPTPVPPKP